MEAQTGSYATTTGSYEEETRKGIMLPGEVSESRLRQQRSFSTSSVGRTASRRLGWSPIRGRVPTAQGINASEEEGDNEVLKWHAMYRESRMLYTINEEEKEGEAATESDCSGGSGLAPGPRG
ncbi:hypothetical protein MLD38_017603 [Melastoma candidum]|uniref:Uncharacterized protein n=1 Tax=Melastoma candidum TaxID=119954 RepID=A0ACB9QR31_9MYRT|nr:hypothetical protein MLD38_017603 [Melastoma candidum]